MVTWATLVVIIDKDKRMLLKKASRGISKGRWNSVGGKMDEGETPEGNAKRETLEETGLEVQGLFYHGVLNFHNFGKQEVDFAVHLFSTSDFSGSLLENSDDGGELRWFPISNLPMEDMWKDDEYWMPHALKKERFNADFYFDKEQKNIVRHEIKVIPS